MDQVGTMTADVIIFALLVIVALDLLKPKKL